MFVWGEDFYGKVDHVPGLFYVKTRFQHLYIPLFPAGPTSFLILDDGTDSPVGVPIPFSWRSLFVAWIRGILGTLIFLGACSLAFPAIAFLDKEYRDGFLLLAAVLGGVAFCGGLYWA